MALWPRDGGETQCWTSFVQENYIHLGVRRALAFQKLESGDGLFKLGMLKELARLVSHVLMPALRCLLRGGTLKIRGHDENSKRGKRWTAGDELLRPSIAAARAGQFGEEMRTTLVGSECSWGVDLCEMENELWFKRIKGQKTCEFQDKTSRQ